MGLWVRSVRSKHAPGLPPAHAPAGLEGRGIPVVAAYLG